MPELSILIVTWNSQATIRDCLDSINKNCQNLSLEVLVWDNASADETAKIIKTEFPQVKLSQSQQNLGFAKGNNCLVDEANSEFILFLNPDTLIMNDSIERMLEYIKDSKTVVALGPKLLYPDNSFQLSYAKFPNLWTEFFTKIYQRSAHQKRSLILKFIAKNSSKTKEVDWISGACLLTRRKVLQELGGFDENFFLYFEDADLCCRLKSKGQIVYYPEANVMHLVGISTKSQNLKTGYHYRKSQLYYYRLHNGRFSNLILKLYLSVKFGLAVIFSNREKKEWYKKIIGLIWSK
ncbi:MAG: hypothetical protein A2145_04770 [candidate division Zixibacteria bacterium RBG_16_40_9]|nr:MAG: hypothetical protein A2145_04770 [candidate division Zixibacteria bacterium RBG_16_40_9]